EAYRTMIQRGFWTAVQGIARHRRRDRERVRSPGRGLRHHEVSNAIAGPRGSMARTKRVIVGRLTPARVSFTRTNGAYGTGVACSGRCAASARSFLDQLRSGLRMRGTEPGTEHVDEGNRFPRQVPRRRVQRVERPLP